MRVSTSHIHQTGVQNMSGQQTQINDSQTQLSSGRRVLRPSDDPISAARTLDIERAISSVERFSRNGELARNRLSMSESALEQAGNQLQRIRELTVQAANDTQDPRTRSYIASEIEERYEQLVQLGNSQDGNGEYLFSGARTRTRPFSMGVDNRVEYLGDQNRREVRVGPGRQMAIDNSGFDVFMKIPNGNGEYQAREVDGNRGSGVVIVADGGVSRLDPPATEYRIRFEKDADDQLRYFVERTHNAQAAWEGVEPPPGPSGEAPEIANAPLYQPGTTVEVEEGVRVSIEGSPEPGDAFTVSTSRPQSLFETVGELIDALDKKGQGPEFRNAINRALGDIDLGLENTLRVRAEIGARMSSLDTERASNEAALVDLKSAKSLEEDLDYAEATGRFNQEITGLQAAQATFGRVQNLSLFDYI